MSSISRRDFMGGATLLAATGALGFITGCSPKTASDTEEAKETLANTASPDETIDCDILVIGAGASGLAACVEGAEAGKKVICIESQSQAGGNIVAVEGCFGINSSMQKAEGINIDTGDIVRQELTQGQYRVNGITYNTLIHRSGENIDWLLDHGVLFGGVDADLGVDRVFHRFGTGNGAESYVPQMEAAAKSAGTQFLFDTHGESLLTDDNGAIVGAIATKKDGAILQIDTPVVIIATGSYMNNEDYMLDLGLEAESMDYIGMPGHDGTGHDMAVAVGAKSNRGSSAPLGALKVPNLPGKFDNGQFFYIGFKTPYAVWVNENGERFVNEDCAEANFCLMQMPYANNQSTYIILDSAMMDTFIAGNAETTIDAAKAAQTEDSLSGDELTRNELADGIAKGSIFQSDSWSDLAAQVGMNPNTLEQTIARYNENVKAGSDGDFGKDPAALMSLEKAPFYAIKTINEILCVCGSVATNTHSQAIDAHRKPIPGLYVVGIEGSMLWANIYSINISGACNANSVNSGRTAARHAIENYC